MAKQQSMEERAKYVFERVREDLCAKIDQAQIAAGLAGAVGGSRVALAFVDAMQDVGINALDECHRSVSVRYKHRGTKWRKAMNDVEQALLKFNAETGSFINSQYISNKAMEQVFTANLPTVQAFLLQRHRDCELGLTGPEPQAWHVRHPIWYASGTAVLSGFVSLAVALLSK